MVKIIAIVRPEKLPIVMNALDKEGFRGVTHTSVLGHGQQRGLKIGEVEYQELPKELMLIVVEDDKKDAVVSIIKKTGRTGPQGTYGDGKIFVSEVEEAYTISSGEKSL